MTTARQAYFIRLVKDWSDAERECRRTYLLWQEACRRRERLAKMKNDAYEEWQASLKDSAVLT